MNYFSIEESAYAVYGDQDEEILRLIGNKFIGSHPQMPYTYRMDFTSGIQTDPCGWYQFDFQMHFPDSQIGQVCFACANIYSHQKKTSRYQIRCYGPTVCKVNGDTLFQSTANNENLREDCSFSIQLEKGNNLFFFSTEKTEIGFGFLFRNAMPQWEPTHVIAPFPEWEGQAGFLYSRPTNTQDISGDLKDIEWLPKQSEEPNGKFDIFDSVFGQKCTGIMVAKSGFNSIMAEKIMIHGETAFPLKVYIDQSLWIDCENGMFRKEIKTKPGRHSVILIYNKGSNSGSPISITFQANEKTLVLNPQIKGYTGEWIYTGPFTEKQFPAISELDDMHTVYEGIHGNCYWKCGASDTCVRMFAEQELYGKWTYPMGVTLYGLLKAGQRLGKDDWIQYVSDYVNLITKTYSYAVYDKGLYGYPGVHTQLCWLDALDDCGSFGSLMLEANKYGNIRFVDIIADKLASYMLMEQKREPDFAYSRADNTMWIDDLYMSVPFLCRYYESSQETVYLDEACKQILLYKNYFFIEQKNLMSHIFFTDFQKANKIPWSRGNGWVLFSLSELLFLLPQEHQDYPAIIEFYNEMVTGILAVQDENGLWHQILDEVTTYEESSSTSMFICALSRGCRCGFLKRELQEQAIYAVSKAWNGMKMRVIHKNGDVFGVCQGSGRSFSRNYYKQLSWKLNDPHGIGIVLLAGTEKQMLDIYLGSI